MCDLCKRIKKRLKQEGVKLKEVDAVIGRDEAVIKVVGDLNNFYWGFENLKERDKVAFHLSEMVKAKKLAIEAKKRG